MAIFESVFAVMVIIANCVLSPSSARKSVMNAVPKIFQSMEAVYPTNGVETNFQDPFPGVLGRPATKCTSPRVSKGDMLNIEHVACRMKG